MRPSVLVCGERRASRRIFYGLRLALAIVRGWSTPMFASPLTKRPFAVHKKRLLAEQQKRRQPVVQQKQKPPAKPRKKKLVVRPRKTPSASPMKPPVEPLKRPLVERLKRKLLVVRCRMRRLLERLGKPVA
jgi:hypothetical protein